MSFEPWKEKSFLIRFEHIMEIDDDIQQSLPVSFNVSHIFPGNFTFTEVTLGANQWIENMSRFHFKQEGVPRRTAEEIKETQMERQINNSLIITLNPMEIRTYIMSPIVDTSHGTRIQTTFGIIIIISIATSCLTNRMI